MNRNKNVNVYRHILTGDIIPISPRYQVIGKKSEKIEKLFKNTNIKKLIEQEILIKLDSRMNNGPRQTIPDENVIVFR